MELVALGVQVRNAGALRALADDDLFPWAVDISFASATSITLGALL